MSVNNVFTIAVLIFYVPRSLNTSQFSQAPFKLTSSCSFEWKTVDLVIYCHLSEFSRQLRKIYSRRRMKSILIMLEYSAKKCYWDLKLHIIFTWICLVWKGQETSWSIWNYHSFLSYENRISLAWKNNHTVEWKILDM